MQSVLSFYEVALGLICLIIADNANLEAQNRGKVSSLCDDGSAFQQYVQECRACITSNGGDIDELDVTFTQYLNYCNFTEAPIASIDVSWLILYTTYVPTTMYIPRTLGGTTYTTLLYKPSFAYSTRPEYFFHLDVGSIVSSYIPASVFSQLAYSVSLSAGAASVTGDATSLVYAALEATSVPSWFSAAVPATYSSQMQTLQEQINQLRATPVSLAPAPTSSPTSSDSLPQTSATSTTGE